MDEFDTKDDGDLIDDMSMSPTEKLCDANLMFEDFLSGEEIFDKWVYQLSLDLEPYNQRRDYGCS